MSEDPLKDFERAEVLRRAATRAWAALDSRERVLKTFRARHRVDETFAEGDLVFVWRQPKVGAGRWHGPGIVMLPTAGGAWVNMRGALWRTANEQMRKATSEEHKGAELVNRYLDSMRADFKSNRGARKFTDVRKEGPPRFPGDVPVENEPDDEELRDLDSDEDFEPEAEESGGQDGTPPVPPVPPESQQATSFRTGQDGTPPGPQEDSQARTRPTDQEGWVRQQLQRLDRQTSASASEPASEPGERTVTLGPLTAEQQAAVDANNRLDG